MSKKHPVIVVTGSSGSGTTTVKSAFEHIFLRNKINPAYVSGDSFHLHNREEFKQAVIEAEKRGNHHFSHFGPESNNFKELESLFKLYGENGSGRYRHYIHSLEEAEKYSERFNVELDEGVFTPYESLPENTDMLFYEGLHGMVRGDGYDVTEYVDLALGVVPVVNIEWIQKIHRDRMERGYTQEEIIDTILRRMPDYVNHIALNSRKPILIFNGSQPWTHRTPLLPEIFRPWTKALSSSDLEILISFLRISQIFCP